MWVRDLVERASRDRCENLGSVVVEIAGVRVPVIEASGGGVTYTPERTVL